MSPVNTHCLFLSIYLLLEENGVANEGMLWRAMDCFTSVPLIWMMTWFECSLSSGFHFLLLMMVQGAVICSLTTGRASTYESFVVINHLFYNNCTNVGVDPCTKMKVNLLMWG